VILEPSVATVVETHSKVNITTIEVNNQMTIIQVQVRNNIVEDVLIYDGASVNIIKENLITKLGLPKPRPTPYHFKMENKNMIRPLRIIRNHQKFEDSYTCYTICSHIHYFEKQRGGF